MEKLFLKAEKRNVIGKSFVKKLRKNGIVPGILYGSGIECVNLSLNLVDIQYVIRFSESSQFLLDLDIDGVVKKVTVNELQRHPVSGLILHVDFYEVAMDRKIKVSIPIKVFGNSKGVELGGMLQIVRREVDVLCLPGNIPVSVDIDVTDLEIGDSIHISEISLPENVEILGDSSFTVLTVLSHKKVEEEDSEDIVDDVEKESEDF